MSESFCVDPSALGQIPSLLDGVCQVLDGSHSAAAAATAAAAVAPGFGTGVTRFGQALDAFVVAGAAAIRNDIAKLGDTAASYQRCELGVVRTADNVGDQLGSSR